MHVEFQRWLDGLRDRRAVARINARLRRISLGNPGDVRSVGDGVMEIRIHHGPGYRLYYVLSIRSLLLLTGGVKDTQGRDVRRAKDLL